MYAPYNGGGAPPYGGPPAYGAPPMPYGAPGPYDQAPQYAAAPAYGAPAYGSQVPGSVPYNVRACSCIRGFAACLRAGTRQSPVTIRPFCVPSAF